MAFINDYVLDAALTKLDTESSHLTICSQEPVTYSGAMITYMLGYKSGISVGAPEDRSPNGRKVIVAAITDGTVNTTGTASHWAIVDAGGSGRLLSTGSLAASQVVTSGNIFTTSAFDIGIPDAV